ncbi:VacJ family lipoprotein [Helicobacter sp. MIT 11-5569]|nr:VacJ family lipoprotein [Helicobacter sp. MIT 11-5569]
MSFTFLNAQDLQLNSVLTHAQEKDILNDFEEEYSTSLAINDPLISYNRWMHNVNWGFYNYVMSPILDAYNFITPLGLRIGLYNFFDNLAAPVRFLAILLAGEPKGAMDELGRFMLNSTAGILGFFDIASENNLYSHHNDFGITFGKWGIGGGFHLTLPILGPSNLRDIIALPLNALASPTNYLKPAKAAFAVDTIGFGNYVARHKATLDSMYQDSLDSYLLFRDSYEQRRAALISEK